MHCDPERRRATALGAGFFSVLVIGEPGVTRLTVLLCALLLSTSHGAHGAAQDEAHDVDAGMVSALRFRSIGPALTSGRIGDIAVDPRRSGSWYVAASSGGVWKTVNAGTTWTPIFDGQSSYSIGCLALDPQDPDVLWVGTGENNSQRSVSFGDGVYRSRNGGQSWQHLGLAESEHIGMIAIDPSDSDVVYVAAQGPLWRSGGERGLYRTRDGGTSWERILDVGDDTGVNEVHLDPRDPQVLYASTYQRRRRVWTLINGGPESGIYKSTDGGNSWRELTSGIPGGDKGRIGLDISPVNPNVIYAIIEAQGDRGGIFRSVNRGETWERRSSYMTSSPQYYNEIICDPVDVDRLYALDTFLQRSDDGGRTMRSVPNRSRHVDDHALWIDPVHPDHLVVGCDGGVYESHDAGEHWAYKANLPITQFYRVAVDNAEPFYNVYGGTQDNATLGGPSRTMDGAGITNADWFVTVGGDGFEPQIDPEDHNIVYSQWQHGGLIRFDRRSSQRVSIKPQEPPGEPAYRWNWDSPLLISPHDNERLYFAANKLFRSDDRGDGWEVVSPDLTRQVDRNQLEVMGRIQPVDAVAKHRSTSFYGNCVALTESPLVEGLLYVGTDDGLIQVTEDGGENWRKIEAFPHVPDETYVVALIASQHDEDVVYAAFDNHKNGDFAPYILRSADRGNSWKPIKGDLPERHIVYTLAEDHERPDLLFAGTEFGVFFTLTTGEKWIELSSGLPTIAVRDIDIQRRENDLVLATFGRGFYVLDDYSPLRHLDAESMDEDWIMPIKPALRFASTGRLGGGLGSQGAGMYAAKNPEYGAVITSSLKKSIETLKDKRKKSGHASSGDDYPTLDDLRAEQEEIPARRVFLIKNSDGEVVRRLPAPSGKGVHRTTWDLHYASHSAGRGRGSHALPGVYQVSLVEYGDGETTVLVEDTPLEVVALEIGTFDAEDPAAVLAFERKVDRLRDAVSATLRIANDANARLDGIRTLIRTSPTTDLALLEDVEAIADKLDEVLVPLRGDPLLSQQMEPSPPSLSGRINSVARSRRNVTSAPTRTDHDAYRYTADAFGPLLESLREIVETDLAALEATLDDVGAPWTTGRMPMWTSAEDGNATDDGDDL